MRRLRLSLSPFETIVSLINFKQTTGSCRRLEGVDEWVCKLSVKVFILVVAVFDFPVSHLLSCRC